MINFITSKIKIQGDLSSAVDYNQTYTRLWLQLWEVPFVMSSTSNVHVVYQVIGAAIGQRAHARVPVVQCISN